MALVRSLVRGVCGVATAIALLGLAWGLGGTAWAASHWPWLADNRWLLVQYVVNGASNGLIIALIALGYTMVYGIVELINFCAWRLDHARLLPHPHHHRGPPARPSSGAGLVRAAEGRGAAVLRSHELGR